MAVHCNNTGARLFSEGNLIAATNTFRAALNTYSRSRREEQGPGAKISRPVPGSRVTHGRTLVRPSTEDSIEGSGDAAADAHFIVTSPTASPSRGEAQENESLAPISAEPPTAEPTAVPHVDPTESSTASTTTATPPTTTTRAQLPQEELSSARFSSIYVATKLIILKPDVYVSPSMTTGALSFNLAVCYHTLSLSVPCRAQGYRLSALRLYKIARHLLRKNDLNNRKKEDDSNNPKMIDMVILNNMGTLLIHTGDRRGARAHFDQLSSAIGQVQHQAPSNKVDCEGFLRI